jgi:predicted aconitase with swiveling domain
MKRFEGKGMVAGRGTGPAIVASDPINFTASLTKPGNLLFKDKILDRHHHLFKRRIGGSVLIFPACIGSTYTGLVLLEIAARRVAPAAMIVRNADPLVVSGSLLGKVWYGRGITMVEYKGDDLYSSVREGDTLTVDGGTGEITIG